MEEKKFRVESDRKVEKIYILKGDLKGSINKIIGKAKAKGSLTATPTSGADRKLGLSDPVVPSGRAIAQRIKATLGITG